jgi:hypothetical protein
MSLSSETGGRTLSIAQALRPVCDKGKPVSTNRHSSEWTGLSEGVVAAPNG